MTKQQEDEVQTLKLHGLVADLDGDLETDPIELQRDRNVHRLLSAWRLVMEAEAKKRKKP